MKASRVLIVTAIVFLLGTMAYFWPQKHNDSGVSSQSITPQQTPSSTPIASPSSSIGMTGTATPPPNVAIPPEIARDPVAKGYYMAVMTPISFYGMVVDENGNPIGGANAEIAVYDKAFRDASTYDKTAGVDGRFSITGVHGLGVGVVVSKNGYYRIKKSSGVYDYATHANSKTPIPTSDNPAIFVLQKKGQSASLIVKDIKASLPVDGSPIEIKLSTGKTVTAGQGDLKVQCWTQDQKANYMNYQPYDWRCGITVPNGGLAARTGNMDFVAPANGYQAYDEIDMPKTATPRWMPQASREYFVTLGDGTYARLQLGVVTAQNNFVTIMSYLNPAPGDRNLEYAPAQQPNGN